MPKRLSPYREFDPASRVKCRPATFWRPYLALQYDGLDRLRVVTSTLFLNETYTFDTLGRMTSRNIGGTNYTLAYSDTAHIDAPTSYSRTGSYGYDENGNQKSGTVNGASQTRSVDAENRVTQVVTGTILATTLTFVYDANGKRIVQTIAPQLGKTSRTLYIGNLYEEDITNGSSGSSPYISYYYLGQKLVGMRRANQTAGNGQYRIVGDYLDSTTLIVDTSSPPSVVQRQYYKPYGESAFMYTTGSGSSLTTYGYTGQRLDGDSGLMYYGARYYDPALSFFVSADPAVPNPAGSKDWNRYLYVRGNPLRYLDFLGYAPEDYYVFVEGCVPGNIGLGNCGNPDWGDYLAYLRGLFFGWQRDYAAQGKPWTWGTFEEWAFSGNRHVRYVTAYNIPQGAEAIRQELASIPLDSGSIHLFGHSEGGGAILRYLIESMQNERRNKNLLLEPPGTNVAWQPEMDRRIKDATLVDAAIGCSYYSDCGGIASWLENKGIKVLDVDTPYDYSNHPPIAGSKYTNDPAVAGIKRVSDPTYRGHPLLPSQAFWPWEPYQFRYQFHDWTQHHMAVETRTFLGVVWK